jgi:F-type H+-transporting ATPase subunit epsilon
MKLEIVTPAQLVFSGDVSYISLAGADGDFGVLPGHAPLISTLRPGVLSVRIGHSETRYAVTSGFADVTPSQVTVLAEDIIAQNAIDLATVRDQLAAAHAERDGLLQAGEKGAKLDKLQQQIDGLRVRVELAEAWALRH